jgi:hypothetical protein
VLEGSNGPGAKEPLVVYNSYLIFYYLTLLKAGPYILFAVANIGGLANVLISTIVDLKDLRWVVPRTYKSV